MLLWWRSEVTLTCNFSLRFTVTPQLGICVCHSAAWVPHTSMHRHFMMPRVACLAAADTSTTSPQHSHSTVSLTEKKTLPRQLNNVVLLPPLLLLQVHVTPVQRQHELPHTFFIYISTLQRKFCYLPNRFAAAAYFLSFILYF